MIILHSGEFRAKDKEDKSKELCTTTTTRTQKNKIISNESYKRNPNPQIKTQINKLNKEIKKDINDKENIVIDKKSQKDKR